MLQMPPGTSIEGVTEQHGLTGCWSCFLASSLGQCIGTLSISSLIWSYTGNVNLTGLPRKSSQGFPIDIPGGSQSQGTSMDHRFCVVSDAVLSYLFSLTSDYNRTKEIDRNLFCIRISISKSFFVRYLDSLLCFKTNQGKKMVVSMA